MHKVISLFGMNLSPQAKQSPPAQHRAAGRDASAIAGDGSDASPAAANPPGSRYLYDQDQRLTQVRYPDGSSQAFVYDRHGNLSRRQTARGRSLRYAYDQNHRLRSITDDLGGTVTIDYGPGVTRWVNSAAATQIAYDDAQRPLRVRQIIDGVGFGTDFEYDAAGSCVAIRPPGSTQWLRYERDAQNRTLRLRAENGRTYVSLGLNEAHFANGLFQRRRLDSQGQIACIELLTADDRTLMQRHYRFNEKWQIVRIDRQQFSYDAAGCLAEAIDESGHATQYTYDARGNRLSERSRTGTVDYTYDDCDRLLQVDRAEGSRIAYVYDRDGNRIGKRNGRQRTVYRYDSQGHLIEVWENQTCTARYAYDGLGRRIRKQVGSAVTVFHYDANGQLIAETDANGSVRATYLWAGWHCLGRIDGAVGEPAGQFYHNDHLGSVQAVSDAVGELIQQYGVDVFGRQAGPFFARKQRDAETGFYDFGARFYDPESQRFLTPDDFTRGPDDWRVLFDPARDFWDERRQRPDLVAPWPDHPPSRNRYLFCLNDPVNHLDPDGHSAWWFLLTIPSSLTWALPNTAIGLLIVVGNILMEIIGWVLWFFICLFKRDFALKHYPWGNRNPSNPFDPNDRDHLWFGLDASARQGVPWALFSGSFFVWRAYTLGNLIFIADSDDKGLKADVNSRYVVPNAPDVQLSARDALHCHEMQHVFQYAYLGFLFHALPVPPLVRLITGAIERGDLTERDKWWERIDLGGLTWLVGGLIHLLSFKLIDPADVKKWIDPATWWSTLLPNKWVSLVSNAMDMDNWLPFVGVYEWDSKFFFDQDNSWFERNAGENSGNVYQTVVEAEKKEVVIGEFTRVVGADRVPQATPTSLPVSSVSFSINPAVTNVGPATTTGLSPDLAPHRIDLNAVNSPPVQVVNATGFYFHSLDPGSFTVLGTGSRSGATESVTIKVKDLNVKFAADAFVCQNQTIRVAGDGRAAYSIRFQATPAPSGGSINNMVYTAGDTAATDTIEVVANYAAGSGAFAKYGDTGLAVHDYVLKTIDIAVKEPTITPDATEVFVGGIVTFAMDHPPQTGSSTSNVAGSQFNPDKRQFIAGKGPITADTLETVTLDYGCRQYTFDITVKPITATVTPDTLDGGGTAQINVTGGVTPFKFVVSDPQSSGPAVDATGKYTAGSENAQVVDTVTITDRNGEGGRARVQVTVQPMTAAANPASVAVGATSQIVAASGVTPFTFAIANRESSGSTIDGNGRYRAGTTPGVDTIAVTDSKGTRVTVTIAVA